MDVDEINNPILAAYLSDQFDLAQLIETGAQAAHSGVDRRRSSTYSYSDRPDYNPGMNNPAEAVPPLLVSSTLMPKVPALTTNSCLMCTWCQPITILWRLTFR